MNRARSTLRALQLGLAGAALVGVVGSVALSGGASPADRSQPPRSAPIAPPMVEATRLVDYYGCWTDEAPADMRGEVPGHVVVLEDGEAVYGGDRLVGMALQQVFDQVDHDLVVVGFCR